MKDVINMNHERLQRIFVYYCSFGEPLNTNKLRSTKFIKLLKDAKMLDYGSKPKRPNTGVASLKTL